MADWEQIYQQYQQGGEAWATLSGKMDEEFVEFVTSVKDWLSRRSLDVGCGQGAYVQWLESLGFEAFGMDTSPTVVKMARELIKFPKRIEEADMYAFEYPEERYDLVYSIAAVHHGYKNQVQVAVEGMMKSLVDGGRLYVTLPDMVASKQWETYEGHEKLAQGTYAPVSGPEKGLAHSFYTEPEVDELFGSLRDMEKHVDELGRWVVRGRK